MFYVIYNSATKQYMNDEGGFGTYEAAAQFPLYMDAVWGCTEGTKIVGPCIEGETP